MYVRMYVCTYVCMCICMRMCMCMREFVRVWLKYWRFSDEILSVGEIVWVKVISVDDGKVSLAMKCSIGSALLSPILFPPDSIR